MGYEDGTPSSAPQMAHEVAEYISFLGRNKVPDTMIVISMVLCVVATFYPISYLFTKQHYINTYSHRFEMYAVKNGGYKKFREKMFKTHKSAGNSRKLLMSAKTNIYWTARVISWMRCC